MEPTRPKLDLVAWGRWYELLTPEQREHCARIALESVGGERAIANALSVAAEMRARGSAV